MNGRRFDGCCYNITTEYPYESKVCTMAMQGVDVGRSELVLHVQPLEGLMRRLDGTVEKRFAKKDILYPLQVESRKHTAVLAVTDCHSRVMLTKCVSQPSCWTANNQFYTCGCRHSLPALLLRSTVQVHARSKSSRPSVCQLKMR